MKVLEWFRVRVAERKMETNEILHLTLKPSSAGRLPTFSAGSHVDVRVPDGPVRQYSLCGAPNQCDAYEIAVLREQSSRGGSQGLHDNIQTGDEIEISAPRNHFALDETQSHFILLAGGIGPTRLNCITMTKSASWIFRPFLGLCLPMLEFMCVAHPALSIG
jgi:vanillate O-demethylase ferredoxin subunit